MKQYCVYILSSYTKVLYIGVTGNLQRRVLEHKNKSIEGFTKKYNVHKLVWYEWTEDVIGAISREKEIKKWRREKKNKLIEENNPMYKDLSNDL